jgi:uncharacterized membrane protein
MNTLLAVALVTFIPGLELRASIPYGVLAGASPIAVFGVAVLANILVGILAYTVLNWFIKIARRAAWFENLWKRYIARLQKRSQAAVDRYGALGLATFIAIPLPGTGAISGAIAAELFGIDFQKFLGPMTLGVLIAGALVLLITLAGVHGWNWVLSAVTAQ